MKSQSAIEFLTIIGLGLIILALTSSIGFDYIDAYVGSTTTIKARQAGNNVASAASLVYSQGVGAQTKLAVTFPSGILRNRTYIGNQEVNIRFEDYGYRDAHVYSDNSFEGSLPLIQGSTYVYAKMTSDGPIVFLNSAASYIIVDMYSDSGRTVESSNFTTGDTIYYNATVYDFDGNPISRSLDASIYSPDGTYSGHTTTATASTISGQYTVSGADGYWLISVLDTELNIVGTALFNKY